MTTHEPPTSDFDTRVRLAILRGFVDGGPTPTVASVAAVLGAGRDEAAAAFDRLAAGRAIVLARGTREIVMSAPFAGQPTGFVVRVGAQSYDVNCIWDALGVPAMLAGASGAPVDADVSTMCADCGAALALRVRGGEVAAEPPSAVVHFAVPAARWWADIVFT
jgi:Alkylmercury lyase